MEPQTKDVFEVAAWIVAVISGLVAVVSFIRANSQRRQDLRWRQAGMAKQCLDELFGNEEARAALKMLDWAGLIYVKPGGFTKPITDEKRRYSLRTEKPVFQDGDDGPFIRDAYDALLDKFEWLEHLISIELIQFEDVDKALRYYIAKMARPSDRPVFERFIGTYDFTLASSFLNRFQDWKRA